MIVTFLKKHEYERGSKKMSWYDVCDFFGSSHAEGMRKKFSKLCSKLNKSISAIEQDLSTLNDGIDSVHKSFIVNQGTAAEGDIETTFVNSELVFWNDCKEVYNKMNDALSDLREKETLAQQELEYWEEECRREDEEERERQYRERECR